MRFLNVRSVCLLALITLLQLQPFLHLTLRNQPRIVSPNITLHPVWEGEAVRLVCILSGFYPDALSVKWQRDHQPLDVQQTQTKLQSVEGEKTFSLSSEIKPDMKEWEKGSSFTCKSVHNNAEFTQTINVCQEQSSPSIHVEIPSFKSVMMAAAEVTALCSVHTAFNAKVTWLMDGSASPSSTVNQNRNSTYITSTLKVSSSQWKQLKRVTCRAEHKCFSTTENTVNVAGPAVAAPEVEIRRSLSDILKGNSVVLICDVTRLSSSDLYITFQADNVDISDKQYVELPEAAGPHSVRRTFSVPPRYWTRGTRFSCTVNQGFSGNFKSQPTGNMFVDPSVELTLAPSEESGPQTLLCSGSGFDPQIHWFSDSLQRSPSHNDTSVRADGRVTVTSRLHVPRTEWETGKVFSCDVSDGSLNKKILKSISLCSVHAGPPSIRVEIHSFKTLMMTSEVNATCRADHTCFSVTNNTVYVGAPVSVTLNPPRIRDVFLNNQAVLECVVTGEDRTTVENVKFTWQTDGQQVKGITEPIKAEGSLYTKTSRLNRTLADYESIKKVTCSVEEVNMAPITEELTLHRGGGTAPKVSVHILPDQDIGQGDSAEVSLVCLVSSPVLQDYYIAWSEEYGQNTGDYTEGLDFAPVKTQHGYSVVSVFTTTKEKWNQNKTFHCNVLPAGGTKIVKPRGVSKAMSNSVECDDE